MSENLYKTEEAEALKAVHAWLDASGGKGCPSYQQVSAPMRASEDMDLDHREAAWRTRCVEDALDRASAPGRYHRALLHDLLWHVHGRGKTCDTFRASPTGGLGARVVEHELRRLMREIGASLKMLEGARPGSWVETA